MPLAAGAAQEGERAAATKKRERDKGLTLNFACLSLWNSPRVYIGTYKNTNGL